MEYINPFSAIETTPDSVSPFLAGYDRANKARMAMPFLDMARQSQQMGLEKQKMENQEFMSPVFQRARQEKAQTEILTNQEKRRALPILTDEEINKAEQNIRMNPYITDQKIAEAKEAAKAAAGKPIQALFAEVANAYEGLQRLPEEARNVAAQQFISDLRARHPGQPLPASLQKYDPTNWALISYANAEAIKHQRSLETEKMKEAAAQKRVETQGSNALAVAQENSRGRIQAQRERIATALEKPYKNEHEAIAGLMPIIQDSETSEEDRKKAKAQLRLHLDKSITDELTKLYGLEQMRNPSFAEQKRKELYQSRGLGAIYFPKFQVGQTFTNQGKQLKVESVESDGSAIVSEVGNPKNKFKIPAK